MAFELISSKKVTTIRLFKNPENQRFTEKHFRKAPKQSRILISNDYRICSVKVNLNVAPPPIEFKDFHPCSQQVHVVEVFHCDGLLLWTIRNDNKYRFMVWNPCSGETRWMETTPNSESFSTRILALGYQNNKSFGSYKILSCWSTSYSLDQGDAGFKIYDLSSDSWRVLEDDFVLNCSTLPNRGVSFKGNAYWLVLEKTSYLLLGFDFTSDSFRRFCLPPVPNPRNLMLSVVREEKLSLLNWSRHVSYMEVWVTHEIYDTQPVLWSKSFTVKNPNNFIPCFKSFLAGEEKKVVLVCNSAFRDSKKLYTIGEDSEYYTEITYGFDKKAKSFFFIVLFIESVNQPSEPTMAMFQHGSLVDFQGRGHFARGQSVIERAEVLDSCQVVAT
ncbi:hypothetical protein F2Q69_00004096 [Brassica cretica]|uniref:F-box associated beta-propeller type 1 domain-containing protein n=1 Tax=Brassica cretica TaxID=69181 RepID=A0A8S9PCW1_BRACR|nr:hypothetical protein F2Q69_00004096 [Brassica cretica]